MEKLEFQGLDMTLWDIGGQHSIRSLWKHYYKKCQAVVFVVDAADRDRLLNKCDADGDSVSFWMSQVSKAPQLQNAVILVLANKQDQKNALSTNEVIDALDLCTTLRGKQWHVQPTVALHNEGVDEAFYWLNKTLQSKINA